MSGMTKNKEALLNKSQNTALNMIQRVQAQTAVHPITEKPKQIPKKKAAPQVPDNKTRSRLNLRILNSIRIPAEKAAKVNQKSLTEVIEELLKQYADQNADKVKRYEKLFKDDVL